MPLQFDSNGITSQDITEILNERENAVREILGTDFIVDKTTPIGVMELADATSELAIQEAIIFLINQLDAETATGVFLDMICRKNNIQRRQPSYTTFLAEVNGEYGTEISQGDLTVSDDTDTYYNLEEDIVIPETGTVLAKFKCQFVGYNFPSQQLNILTPMSGLNSVTINYDNANVEMGTLPETDEDLRVRRKNSVQKNSSTLMESIKSNIFTLEGVRDVSYIENYNETTDEWGVPMKSFEFIVDGGDVDEITDVIFVNKTIGTRPYGTTTRIKTDSENNIYEIGYTPATKVDLKLKIILDIKTLQPSIWEQTIKENIKKDFDNRNKIYKNVNTYDFYQNLVSEKEITNINSIKLIKNNIEYDKVEIGRKEIANLLLENIEIEQVV